MATVAALVVGGVVGYVAGLPERDDLRDDKESAETALATTRADLTRTQQELDETTADLEAAGLAAEAAEVCQSAADHADDLISAWADVAADIDAWWATEPGSEEELQLGESIESQLDAIQDQDSQVQGELSSCRDAMRQT